MTAAPFPTTIAARMHATARAARPTPTGTSRGCTRSRASSALRCSSRVLALRGRPQSPARRRLALSGPEHDRPVPDRPVQRRAGVSSRVRMPSPDEIEARVEHVLAPVPRGACRASCSACGRSMAAWCCGKAIRSAANARSCSKAACRTSTSAPPAAPVARHVLQAAARMPCLAQARLRFRRQRPLQGRLHHPPLRRSRTTASMPCNWRSASGSTWTSRHSPGMVHAPRGTQAILRRLLEAVA